MKVFFSYIKRNRLWLFIILILTIMMTALMHLNQVAVGEMVYGLLLCLLIFVIVFCVGLAGYGKDLKRLKDKEKDICMSLEGLNNSEDVMDLEYKRLLEILSTDRMDKINTMEKSARDRKEYYAMWVHQIKTPIAALKLLLQERGKGMEVSEEQTELFLVEQYVEMVLSYSRLDSDSTDFLLQKTKLDQVVREAVHKYAILFIKKKIALNYQELNTQVITDEKWFGFVVEQLLSNAVKYTKTGSVSIYMEAWDELREGRRECGQMLIIEDTGIGIRPEDLPRIFEKGYTGFNGRVDKSSTGIGLYLCKQIMEKLSLGLMVESEAGVGTKVKIRFPDTFRV